jgi:hypothetical protein
VGGYDENFRLAFGDIDFCLRIQALGYRNVYTPFAETFHFEGMSRGYTTPIEDIKNAHTKFQSELTTPDPNYSEHLSLTVIPKYLEREISLQEREGLIQERMRFYQNK